jgi:hypothetical protein
VRRSTREEKACGPLVYTHTRSGLMIDEIAIDDITLDTSRGQVGQQCPHLGAAEHCGADMYTLSDHSKRNIS